MYDAVQKLVEIVHEEGQLLSTQVVCTHKKQIQGEFPSNANNFIAVGTIKDRKYVGYL